MSVSFYGTQETVLSFEADGVTGGMPVVISANYTVSNAAENGLLAGVALHTRGEHASVQVKGYVELPYSGTAPALGWANLAADGLGGVKAYAEGRPHLVISLDTVNKIAGLYL